MGDKNHTWVKANDDLSSDKEVVDIHGDKVHSLETYRRIHGFAVEKCETCGLVKIGDYLNYDTCEEYLAFRVLEG